MAGGLLYLALFFRARAVELGIAAAFIGVLSYLAAKVANALVSSPRPFMVTGQKALIPSATDNGFPSDHTLLLAALAAVVTLANPRAGAVFWVLTLVVGTARVYAGVHHPIDIAGSIAIVGLVTALYIVGRRVAAKRRSYGL